MSMIVSNASPLHPGEQDPQYQQRCASMQQELVICQQQSFKRWALRDTIKTEPLEKIIGIVALPFVFFWFLLFACFALMMGLVLYVLKGVGRLSSALAPAPSRGS